MRLKHRITQPRRPAFTVHHRCGFHFCVGVFLAMAWLAASAAQGQTTTYALGTTNLLVGPAAGSNSVVLGVTPATGLWTATANANWLHLSLANQSGTGSTNVIFSYDANAGATRSGNLSLGSQTLAITQAGSTYVAAGPVTTLVSTGLGPAGLTLDGTGNVYFTEWDMFNAAVCKWTAANDTVTTLVSSGMDGPDGVAVDGAGNVYIGDFSDWSDGAIKKWTAANSNVTILVSLSSPRGVAVDGTGNLYIADYLDSAIKKWTAANDTVTTLVSSGLYNPSGVALDGTGNVYIADTGNTAIKEWTAANSNVTTLVSSGLSGPFSVALDGTGNVYIADSGHSVVKEWMVANSNVITLVSSGLNYPLGVAVDGAGNVYIADTGDSTIREMPHAFVDPTAKSESLAAGNDALPVVLPVTANLFGPFAPTSDEPWLTITGITNGVVGFSFTAYTGFSRTAHITLLGQTITVTQGAPTYTLGTNALFEGANSGSDSVVLTVSSETATWTATANVAWLHLTTANQSGIGSTNVVFSFDANLGDMRTGTLTIAGQTLTVTQAGAFSLGTCALLEGPTAGGDSVVLAVNPNIATWTAMANAAWLHLGAANQSGTGSTNVVFSYDPNPGATRSGTLTIGGLTVTVTQAGSTYVSAGAVTVVVSSGPGYPGGLAVDRVGNIYTGENYYFSEGLIYEWLAANNTLITLVPSETMDPCGMAVDGAGNLYFADARPSAIGEWTAANSNLTTLVSSELNQPQGVALDGAGNVYIADTGDNAIKEWTAANSNVITLVSTGLSSPEGMAVDGAGNVYIADTGDNAIKEWTAANSNVTTLVSSGLSSPSCVAVDGSGNVYIADTGDNAIKKWTVANNTVTTLLSSGLNQPFGVAVDATGNVYIADSDNYAIKELPYAFVDPTDRLEGLAAGTDSLPVVLPATENLLAPFTPYADSTWLTISGFTNGVVSFGFTATSSNRTGHIILLGQTIPVTQGGPAYSLGTTALLEGPSAGSDSVVLGVIPNFGNWMATANASWLHVSPENQSGTGSTNVVFSFDANSGATRSGTLTVAGMTLTVTQAGSTYVPATPVATLPSVGPGPDSVAVDRAGNLYVGNYYEESLDYPYGAIYEQTVSNTTTALFSAEWDDVRGLAVDGAGNVYFSSYWDQYNSAIYEWIAASKTVTTLVSTGVLYPCGVAVDGAGNLYIADAGDNAIKAWSPVNSNLTSLVSTGLNDPTGVAVDAAGNVYIADLGDNAIKELMAANGTLTTLIFSNLNAPESVAVNGSGNVYVADTGNNAIKEWIAASNTVSTLVSSGLNQPGGVAVDGLGNVYIADTGYSVNTYPFYADYRSSTIEELVRTFVDPTLRLERLAAGQDSLPAVVPATQNLRASFAPVSHEPWLTITGITNGVVSFSFTATTSNRTGYITLLGQTIPVAQGTETFNYSLGTSSLLEGPSAGSDSVVLAVSLFFGPWTATTNATWLHLSPENQSGTGSTNVVFSFDANMGATRSGTLTIAGQTLTVTQAGATYVAAGVVTALVSSGISNNAGVAVDGAGNVYIADQGNNAIKKWTVANNQVTPLVTSGLSSPTGVAVDRAGNVYIADQGNNAVKEWTAANNTVTTLVSSGLSSPTDVAVDGAGNVYIAGSCDGTIKEWVSASNAVTTLVSSLSYPYGVAVDGAGDVYIAVGGNNAIEEWTSATGNVITLVSSGLSIPFGVAVDGAGDVYVGDYGDSTIKKWTAANSNLTALVSAGLSSPTEVAVDGARNVYIADYLNNATKELPYAFVDPTTRLEGATAGNDALPVVLPATENLLAPFAPTSDQAWLTISGITNGVVSYSFTATTSNRTAHITLLGQSIPVTQGTATYAFSTNAVLEGPTAGSDSVFLEVNPNTATWTATANAAWLHLSLANQSGTGSTNLVFSYDANPGAMRSGIITVAGQTLTVTQSASFASLGASALLEGPTAGSDSVVLAVIPANATWTATTNATWLHLSLANQSGTGSTNVVFSYDANPGGTRTGTLSFDGQTLTVTQAGSTYVAAGTVTVLVASGLNSPYGVAVDSTGRVDIADTFNSAIKQWTAANNAVTTLVSLGLNIPCGVAVDGSGNVYFADTYNQAIKEWSAANSTVTALVASGLNQPSGVAVDREGNVFFTDTYNQAIKEWTAANSNVTTLVSSGLDYPIGVAVDAAGNVYIADTLHGAIKQWAVGSSNVLPLAISGLSDPFGVAVDGSGNVYVADTGNSAIRKWTAANSTVASLVSSGLSYPYGVAVDGADDVYIADTDNQAIKELPRAFVDPTPKVESLAAGSDALPVVLPATANLLAPFAPTSDQAWLAITGITNGVVSFSFTTATSNRTAHITVLGQSIPVAQLVASSPPTLGNVQMLGQGVLQFAFTNTPGASFTVLSTTNLSLPLNNWTVVGSPTNIASGVFQFTSQPTTNDPQRFYIIRSP
jgi:DNA-binding beta-propeller fold protein YncE